MLKETRIELFSALKQPRILVMRHLTEVGDAGMYTSGQLRMHQTDVFPIRYRNFLMACAALMSQQIQSIYFALLDDPFPPGVRNLQRWLEAAWKEGVQRSNLKGY
jgi:hypothetical protein